MATLASFRGMNLSISVFDILIGDCAKIARLPCFISVQHVLWKSKNSWLSIRNRIKGSLFLRGPIHGLIHGLMYGLSRHSTLA
jgi:hypothetical protein